MRIIINGQEKNVPSSLSEITLWQRIQFQEEHGHLLEKMAESITAMQDGPDKELETIHFHFEKMFRTVAFFTGIDVEVIKESEFIDELAEIYYSTAAVIFEEEKDIQIQPEYEFAGELWEIQPPELTNGSKMTFGELVDSKQIVKDMIELGKGRWGYMLQLCAIFFRKKGESYSKEFVYEGSDRMELLKSLPMDKAIAVGFFLTGTLNFYLNTLMFSGSPGLRVPANIQHSTMNATAG